MIMYSSNFVCGETVFSTSSMFVTSLVDVLIVDQLTWAEMIHCANLSVTWELAFLHVKPSSNASLATSSMTRVYVPTVPTVAMLGTICLHPSVGAAAPTATAQLEVMIQTVAASPFLGTKQLLHHPAVL